MQFHLLEFNGFFRTPQNQWGGHDELGDASPTFPND